MNGATATAETSSAPVVEIERGPLVNLTGDERAEFRRTGELPEPPKKQEAAATSDGTKESKADAGEAASPTKPQEIDKGTRRKPDAEKRIGDLTAETRRLKAELEALKSKPATPAETPRAQPQQQQATRTKPTVDDKGADGKARYATYEDFIEDLADWKAEQRWASTERERQQRTQQQELNAKVEDARSRYQNFDEVLKPTLSAIVDDAQVSPAVKAMMNDSDVLPDLIFTIGSDPKELAAFVQMAKSTPGKALRYIALTESLIAEELASKATPKGAAKPKADAKLEPVKTQTAAPKPPAEVGGRAASPPDAEESAAQSGDFRRFKVEADRKYLARLRA